MSLFPTGFLFEHLEVPICIKVKGPLSSNMFQVKVC